MRPFLLGGALVAGAMMVAACSSGGGSGSTGEAVAGAATTAVSAETGSGSGDGGTSVSGRAASCEPATSSTGDPWEDRTAALGLDDPLIGLRGHATAVGDVDDDGWVDLFVGSFADRPLESYRERGADGPQPDRLLLGSAEGFTADESFPGGLGRTSGAAFADLDGDDDLDLVVARNPREGERADLPTVVLENVDGSFSIATELDTERGARSVGILDYDGDGLLDVFLVEDRFTEGRSVLLHNEGGLTFEDTTTDAGLPDDLAGLGVAAADLDGDSRPDLFVAGDNRLFVNDGGTFTEVDGPFEWELFGDEDDPAGVAAGDVNGDGLVDLVVGQHFNSTIDFDERVPVRLYLNRGSDDSGGPTFEDVTDESGLVGLPTKAPHVELVDIDGDGLVDIVTTASAADGVLPAVLLNEGGDPPRFSTPDGLGSPQYWISGAVFDADSDGVPEIFLVEWEPALGSKLFEGPSVEGDWVTVAVGPAGSRGVGAVVEVYEAGADRSADALIAAVPITASVGFGAGAEPVARIGVGDRDTVDVTVVMPNEGERIEVSDVAAGRRLVIDGPCP